MKLKYKLLLAPIISLLSVIVSQAGFADISFISCTSQKNIAEDRLCSAVAKSTVLIFEPNELREGKSRRVAGSGVIIKKRFTQDSFVYLVLTAKHVVKRENHYTAMTFDGRLRSVEPTSINKLNNSKKDVAILEFSSKRDYKPIPIGELADESSRETIYASGFSLNRSFQFIPGNLRRFGELSSIYKGAYDLTYTNQLHSGMSGGPIVNQNGQLLGINAAILPFAISAGVSVNAFIKIYSEL